MKIMDGNKYQELAMRTNRPEATPEQNLINGCLGLAGEAGEVCDIVKKYVFQGHNLETQKIVDELSDVLWYVALTAQGIGCDLDSIMEHNINKLKKRYPNGFEAERSINRTE